MENKHNISKFRVYWDISGEKFEIAVYDQEVLMHAYILDTRVEFKLALKILETFVTTDIVKTERHRWPHNRELADKLWGST